MTSNQEDRSRWVEVDGARVHYLVSPATPSDAPQPDHPATAPQQHPPLVLIHGTGLDAATNWSHVASRFADRTVIRPDLAGSGETVDDGSALRLDALADQVAAAIRAEGAVPVDLVGYSLGAEVAAAVAARDPELVGRLVLVAGWVRADARQNLIFELWTHLARTDPLGYGQFITTIGYSAGFLARLSPERIARVVAQTIPAPGTMRQIDLDQTIDLGPVLSQITAPTLVIGNTHDQLVPVEHARAVHDAIPGSEYLEIPSGHLVVFERLPDLLAALSGFLDR